MAAVSGGARLCPRCGAAANPTQRFCGKCGGQLPQLPAASAPAQPPTAPPPPQPSPPASPPPDPPAPGPVAPPASWPAQQAVPLPAGSAAPAAAADALPWPAWLGAGACCLLVVATGLSFFGGFEVDAFDIPLAALWTDTATGGIPFAALLLLVAAVGVVAALIAPARRTLGTAFLSTGTAGVLVLLWYGVRVLSTAQGAPFFDVFSVGAWAAALASIALLGSGLALLRRRR